MQRSYHRERRPRRHGAILLSVLVFVVIIALILAGTLNLLVSHSSRVHTEADYAAALDLADAGINFELRKISAAPTTADQTLINPPTGVPNGVSYTLGNGTFYVYCTNRDGTTPWITTTSTVSILCTGIVNGTSRTVMVNAKLATDTGASFALYAIKNGQFSNQTTVSGNVGSNGSLVAQNLMHVNGTLALNGAGAFSSGPIVATTRAVSPTAVSWQTVHAIANTNFPLGGLAWLATHNDNALCSSIVGNQLNNPFGGAVTLPGKAGGANYYLTGITFSSDAHITFDNTLGPVTVWLGPDGATASSNGNPFFDFHGKAILDTTISSTINACTIYDSTTGPLTFEEDTTCTVNLYSYNTDSSSNAIGYVDMKSPKAIDCSIVANTILFEGAGTVSPVNTLAAPGTVQYFAYDNTWSEINGM